MERIDRESRTYRLYRDALASHWDPHDLDLSEDRVRIARLSAPEFTAVRQLVAVLGTLGRAGTGPTALHRDGDSSTARLGAASQAYAAARQADLADTYWEEVLDPEEHARGNDLTDPTDDRWIVAPLAELLSTAERALQEATPGDPQSRARADALCSLVLDGGVVETACAGGERAYGGEEGVELPGLVDALAGLRRDATRTAELGVQRLREAVASPDVSSTVVEEVLEETVDRTEGAVQAIAVEGPLDAEKLLDGAAQRRRDRLRRATDPEASAPDLQGLLALESYS